jgi:hypothetical protein
VKPCSIDHITITSPTLEAGAEYVLKTLGVAPQAGGEHPRMGTHNLLLRLGNALFLEVISPNPAAPPPSRPRWFDLDRLPENAVPALTTWVVRTDDIHASLAACVEPLGAIEPMTRGALNWLITIPADGSVPGDGVAPALIQWQTDTHPASRLEDAGLSLAMLEVFHPEPARMAKLLASIGLDGPVSLRETENGAPPRLVAHINTPRGLRQL